MCEIVRIVYCLSSSDRTSCTTAYILDLFWTSNCQLEYSLEEGMCSGVPSSGCLFICVWFGFFKCRLTWFFFLGLSKAAIVWSQIPFLNPEEDKSCYFNTEPKLTWNKPALICLFWVTKWILWCCWSHSSQQQVWSSTWYLEERIPGAEELCILSLGNTGLLIM